MYNLWQQKYISTPSEYWNMSFGDKLVLKAFYERYVDDQNNIRKELKKSKAPIFPVSII